MAGVQIGPAIAQPQLMPGVEYKGSYGSKLNTPFNKNTGGYWFDGEEFASADEANQYAKHKRDTAQANATAEANRQASMAQQAADAGRSYFSPGTDSGGGISVRGSGGGGISSPMQALAGAYTPPGGGMTSAPTYGFNGGGEVGVSGNGLVSQGAADAQQLALLQGKLAQEELQAKIAAGNHNFQQRLSAIQALDTSGGIPRIGAGSNINSNEAAARAAAFARAKDLAGQNGNAAIQALKDAMGSRGLHGSTIENNELANIVGNAGGNVNSYIQQQLMADLNRSADIADRTYAGDITQRGQDLSRYQTLLGLLAGGGSLY